jgi:hypothetical protein
MELRHLHYFVAVADIGVLIPLAKRREAASFAA